MKGYKMEKNKVYFTGSVLVFGVTGPFPGLRNLPEHFRLLKLNISATFCPNRLKVQTITIENISYYFNLNQF